MFNFRNKKVSIFWILLLVMVLGLCSFTSLHGWGNTQTGNAKNIILGLDLKGGVNVTYEIQNESFTEAEFEDTKSKLEERANSLSTESEVYAEGENRIVVNIPGQTDANEVLEKLGKKGKLSFATIEDEDTQTLHTWLEGADIANAEGTSVRNTTTGATEYVVDLTFTEEGATKFAEATNENVGNIIYIIYDDEVISSPVVNSEITGGTAEINGMSSLEEASSLASMIRIGNLNLDLEAISHKVIGARLGTDALQKSLLAGLIGLILICLFMIINYRLLGVIASFSLTLYILLVLETLNAFDITLTLPGIAGIILGIGMAVDANIIIFTRIREELGQEKNLESSIKTGFQKANSAIIDGNITTLIAAGILILKGSGTVQGFGQTLAIGIVWSMFVSLCITRILTYALYHLGLKKTGLYGKTKTKKIHKFTNKKVLFFGLSLLLIGVGLVSFVIKGFNYSVEFEGGKTVSIEFDKEYSIDEFNETIQPKIVSIVGSSDVTAQKETDSNIYTIKLQDVDESVITEIKDTLVADFGAIEDTFNESFISATISNEMSQNAIVATIIASICILLYIWIRFKNLSFAFSAILALLHDVLIVLTFYLVSQISVGTTFIACILTIVGYSINATIVIFDRIRENLQKYKKEEFSEIIDRSISETLSRTINTSLTTFITVFIIFIMGVPSLQEFTLPLMIGIICGAYSSVCITGNLLQLFYRKKKA